MDQGDFEDALAGLIDKAFEADLDQEDIISGLELAIQQIKDGMYDEK